MLESTASVAVLISWSGWKRAAAYFPAKMHKTADLDPAGNYLFACHPHGITSFRQDVLQITLACGSSVE